MTPHSYLGVILATAFLVVVWWASGRWLQRRLALTATEKRREWAFLAGVGLVAAWAMRPFFFGGMIGAGDSYHYALQIADFLTQLRHGVVPVLIGQSQYGFNGNVQTVRTAPYFTALSAVLDFVTVRDLPFFALKNFVIITTGWGAAFAAYAVVRLLAPTWRAAALALSAPYITSPAILGPLIGLDMDATFMAAPWLPVYGYGLVLSCELVDDTAGLLTSVGALAAIWYCHPPTAAWLTPALVAVQLWRVFIYGGRRSSWLRQIGGVLLFAALTGYIFYSVFSLKLAYTLGAPAEVRQSILTSLKTSWSTALRPLDAKNSAAFLQLGWSGWAVLLAAIAVAWSRSVARIFLLLGTLLLLLFLLPIPRISAALWSLVPSRLLDITNAWPEQRFYPILAAATLVLAALALRDRALASARFRRGVLVFLSVACLWSVIELRTLHQRADQLKIRAIESNDSLRPENAPLTRSSYILFNRQPDNYSDGWVDPEFASRLLDSELNIHETNEAAALATAAPELASLPAIPVSPDAELDLDRSEPWLLVFQFAQPAAVGEVSFRGAAVRAYTLPSSGGPRAFGSGPLAAKTVTLRADPGAESALRVHATVPGVSVKAIRFRPTTLPIQLRGLMPYEATVRASVAGYLETPQVFVPGYKATVNGVVVPVRHSFEGLVAVPVPAGASDITVSYPGPPGLNTAWWLAVLSFCGLAFARPRWRNDIYQRIYGSAAPRGAVDRAAQPISLFAGARALGARRWATITAVTIGVAALTIFVARWTAAEKATRDSLRLVFNLPRWSGHRAEPLLVTGREGRADCLYIIYADATHVRLGLDHWALGGPTSPLLSGTRGDSHVLEVTSAALDARAPDGRAPLLVRYDGQVVWDETLPYYAARPDQVYIGQNPVGSSTCQPDFTGEILAQDRVKSPERPAPPPPPAAPAAGKNGISTAPTSTSAGRGSS